MPFRKRGRLELCCGLPPFNLAKGIPHDLVDDLSGAQAAKAAMDAPAIRILTDLRTLTAALPTLTKEAIRRTARLRCWRLWER